MIKKIKITNHESFDRKRQEPKQKEKKQLIVNQEYTEENFKEKKKNQLISLGIYEKMIQKTIGGTSTDKRKSLKFEKKMIICKKYNRD